MPAAVITPATLSPQASEPTQIRMPAAASMAALTPLLQARVLSHRGFVPAATAFVSELALAYGCSRVSIGFAEAGRAASTRVRAVSGGGQTDLDGAEYDALAEAMDEARQQEATVRIPQGSSRRSTVSIAHQRLRTRHGGVVLTVPLLLWGESVGAVTFEWADPLHEPALQVPEMEVLVSLIAPILDLMRRRERALWLRLGDGLRETVAQVRRHRARRWLALTALLSLIGLLAVPLPHQVGGQARVESVQQRTLVAPMDGFLKRVHVRPGDPVRQGQPLLEMADEDLLLQQRKWQGEIAQQEHAYAAALATSDRAAMVIALARTEQSRSQLALIEADLARTVVLAPFDGQVLQGDLSQTVGAPLERGKALLVLAPGHGQRVIVHVDERDIARVVPGQTGRLAVSALPWQNVDLVVDRVTPVARVENGRNGFEVEARLAQGDASRVRPGLQGVAQVGVGYSPLAWVWGERLLDRARLAWWRWTS